MSNSKDKRTKEQILRLLDNAMTQEELLAERIKRLETELADCNTELANCRKKAEDPRHELTEEAMPASKVSFRIDYYRTSEESSLKGIIEHLPSRQNKSFEGEGQLIISHFMSRFLTEEVGTEKKKQTSVEEKIAPAPLSVESEKKVRAMQGTAPQQEEMIATSSQLLQRLRAELVIQGQTSSPPPTVAQQARPPQKSARIERLLSKATSPSATQTAPSNEDETAPQAPLEPHSQLLERLLEKFKP